MPYIDVTREAFIEMIGNAIRAAAPFPEDMHAALAEVAETATQAAIGRDEVNDRYTGLPVGCPLILAGFCPENLRQDVLERAQQFVEVFDAGNRPSILRVVA